MDNRRPASAIPACNMIIALLIFAQIPIMYGKAAPNAVIYAMPWLMSAFPIILICIVLMYKNGEFVDATMNAILSGVLMGQNFVRGIISLAMYSSGIEPSMELTMSSAAIDMWVYLVAGIILLTAGFLAFAQCKMAAIGIWAGGIGFLGLSGVYAGLGNAFGLIGATGLVVLAVYLLYAGLAIMINTAVSKAVLPLK